MAGPDRAVQVLRLFTVEKPDWSVEQAARALGVSAPSAYRYFAALVEAGLLSPSTNAHYVLGPAIIQYDRQIQLTDPMLRAARPIMADLIRFAPAHSVVLLCRIFRDVVLCMHQVADGEDLPSVSYERGRPMPLFSGATSKAILAHLAPRDLRRLHQVHADAIKAAGLGSDWDEFRAILQKMRKAGHVISASEVDRERVGIAAPIFSEKRVVGSLSYVIPQAEEGRASRLVPLVAGGAREIEQAMLSTA